MRARLLPKLAVYAILGVSVTILTGVFPTISPISPPWIDTRTLDNTRTPAGSPLPWIDPTGPKLNCPLPPPGSPRSTCLLVIGGGSRDLVSFALDTIFFTTILYTAGIVLLHAARRDRTGLEQSLKTKTHVD